VRDRSGTASTVGRAGDVDRFGAVHDRHVRAVTAYCVRRVGRDRADDAVAETFLVAWRRIDDVPDGDAALLWLYRVAHRVIGREWRSVARRRRLSTRVGSLGRVSSPTPEEAVIDSDEVQRVLAAADHLNPSDTEVLRLVAWERLTAVDIAAVLGVSSNVVHQRLHRARRNLTRRFDMLEDHPVRSPVARKGGAR
jgi:RNA polymerase sigma-70 factor (ECF subfamily)